MAPPDLCADHIDALVIQALFLRPCQQMSYKRICAFAPPVTEAIARVFTCAVQCTCASEDFYRRKPHASLALHLSTHCTVATSHMSCSTSLSCTSSSKFSDPLLYVPDASSAWDFPIVPLLCFVLPPFPSSSLCLPVTHTVCFSSSFDPWRIKP